MTFQEDDFTDGAKTVIKEWFDSSGFKDFTLLTGLVDIEYCYSKIKPRLNLPVEDVHNAEGSFVSTQRHRDMKVAARWGDKAWLSQVIADVEKEKPHVKVLHRFSEIRHELFCVLRPGG